jgi:predicted aldo/keto reductase-like oxidoreductase
MNKLDSQLNSEKIMNEISGMIAQGVPYIDAIVEYCEVNSLEIEVAGEIIRRSPILKAKIHEEAEHLNLVQSVVRLPADVL